MLTPEVFVNLNFNSVMGRRGVLFHECDYGHNRTISSSRRVALCGSGSNGEFRGDGGGDFVVMVVVIMMVVVVVVTMVAVVVVVMVMAVDVPFSWPLCPCM
jgi:hypothetical protein